MAETSQWEYRSLTLGSFWSPPKDDEIEAALNTLGQEGWEAVNAFHEQNSNRVRVVFKRVLTADNARRQRRQNWPGGT